MYSFGDGFDCYSAVADMATGYWDSIGAGSIFALSPSGGRFGGQAIASTTFASAFFTKTSGVNDAVHHIAVAYKPTLAISGTLLGAFFQLLDGTTGQCAIVFKSNGDILLTSGTAGGATLATYTGAFTVTDTWYHFEIEVGINNTTGSFKVRKDGNSTEDYTATGLNTRPTSTNNYANKLVFGQQTNNSNFYIDDLFWRSDASSVAWLGDICCHTRMPASDASVTWSRSGGASNFSNVDEAQQNTTTDYVYSSTAGQEDFYGIASIASTPATVIATTVRAYAIKSDIGTRTAAVQLKSGATTVASSTLTLTTSGWQWAWRMDLTDPDTGSAWTAAAVNAVNIGPKIVA